MGIPSYYKKLADFTKGLVSKSYEGKPSALYFDFNCMIYHCARRPNSTLPPYPGLEGNEEWERVAHLGETLQSTPRHWCDGYESAWFRDDR